MTVPGYWYSNSTNLRWQTDAFSRGSVALDSEVWKLRWDLVWDHGIQQVWGLGVPAFRFLFEILAHAFGFASFPDRVAFLIGYFLCAFYLLGVLCRPFFVAKSGSELQMECTKLRTVTIFILMVFAPPFITLVSTRFEAYEEVAAYGYLWALVLFAMLLRFDENPGLLHGVLLSVWAGLGAIVRPTLFFYAAVTLALGILIAWRAKGIRIIVTMTSAFGIFTLLLCYLNWFRFGAPGEFGHSLNVGRINSNIFSLKFDYPFRKEPFCSAFLDELGSLFFLRKQNGHNYYQQGCVGGQSSTYRWHEMYFSVFNIFHLWLLAASSTLWLLNWRRVCRLWTRRGIWFKSSHGVQRPNTAWTLLAIPWSMASFACLFVFYLWSPSIASRYNVDFLPAVVVAIGGLVWNGFAFNPSRRQKLVKIATLGTWLSTLVWIIWGVSTAEISPGYHNYGLLDASSVIEMTARPSKRMPMPSLIHYHRGDTNAAAGIPYNCEGWDLVSGAVQPVVTVFASDPDCVMLSLVSSDGTSISSNELAVVRAKIGLEELVRESTKVHSNNALVVFRGPRRARYRSGLQVCFLGFLPASDLGRRNPPFCMAGISFDRNAYDLEPINRD